MYRIFWALLCLLPLIHGDLGVAEYKGGDAEHKIIKLILDTFIKARKGITTSELLDPVKQIQSLINTLGNKVSEGDVVALINSVKEKIQVPTNDKKKLDPLKILILKENLSILIYLAQTGQEKLANGQSVDVVLAAIGQISGAIVSTVADMEKLRMTVNTYFPMMPKDEMKIYFNGKAGESNKKVKRMVNQADFCVCCCSDCCKG